MLKILKFIAIISGILASLIGIFLGILKIWEFYRPAPSMLLQAEVLQIDAPFPQSVAEDIKDLSTFPLEWIRKQDVPESKQVSDQIFQKVIPVFEKITQDEVDRILKYFSKPTRLTIIKIINPFDETITGVQIKVPSSSGELFAQIVRDDNQPEIQKFKSNMNIGALSPRAEVTVYVYCNAAYSFYESEILITHDKGLSNLKIHSSISSSQRWRMTWIERPSITWVGIILFVLAGLLACITFLSDKVKITFPKRDDPLEAAFHREIEAAKKMAVEEYKRTQEDHANQSENQ